MHLRPLTGEQAEVFIRNWYHLVETGLSTDPEQAGVIAKERADRLLNRLTQPEFRARRVFELTRNPLLLTNLCLVHRDRGNLPRTRSGLYEECIDVLLELWRGAAGVASRITARSARRVLQPAAFWMHRKRGRTRAAAKELAPVMDPAIKKVRWPHGSAEDFLKAVRDDSGLLTGWDQEHYGFMHLGFQEYLAALEIKNLVWRNPKLLRQLAELFGKSWWREVTLILLARDNPCLFEEFMREVVKTDAFIHHLDMVEMCIDDAAEASPVPFLELLETDPGEDGALWKRQAAALTIADRLDETVVDPLLPKLKNHPADDIRAWVKNRLGREEQDVFIAEPGGYELVFISGGVFMMGSSDSKYDDERPVHEVRVRDFYMGRHPVTNEEYGRFLAANPDAAEPKFWGDRRYNQPQQPVVGVGWYEAGKYAAWAGLRLPTEAEWEYACRAGTQTHFFFGDCLSADQANYDGNYPYGDCPKGEFREKLLPVGSFEPNAWGLYDMHGNVDEWVEDDWHDNYKKAPVDGSAWVESPRGSRRVFRSGGWYNGADGCRSAYRRSRYDPGGRSDDLGFRLASDAP